MGQQRHSNVRSTNTDLKKTLNFEPVKIIPGPYNSYPKVARNQPKLRDDVIIRYLQNYPAAQTLSKNFERPKAARKQMPSKTAKTRNQSVSLENSIIVRSLPTQSEFEFRSYTENKTATVKEIKHANNPKSKELATKKVPKGNSHKDLQNLPKKLQYNRKAEQKVNTNAKKNATIKPIFQSLSTQSKIYRNAEMKRREIIKSMRLQAKLKTPDINQAKLKSPDINQAKLKSPDINQAKPKIAPKLSLDSKSKQKNIIYVPASKSFAQRKKTDLDYPVLIGFREQCSLDPTEVCHSLPKLPVKLRSILKSSMNYSQIKKLDEDSLQNIIEGKGPVDECLCHLLSNSESREKGIKASIKRAFASFSGGKKKGGGGQNSVDITLPFDQRGKGGLYSTKEVLKRKSPCGKCGCDKGQVVLKHSYANIRITTPDLSTICPCPEDCFPDKDKYNGKIKVTVERMTLNSDDSEISLHKPAYQHTIPEPMMLAAMDDRSVGDLSERSEWSSGN